MKTSDAHLSTSGSLKLRTWLSLGKWMRPSNYLTPLLGLRATACTGHFARGWSLYVRRRFSEIGGSPQRHYLCYVPRFMTGATQLSDCKTESRFSRTGRPLRWAIWLAHAPAVLRNAFGSFSVAATGCGDEPPPRATPIRAPGSRRDGKYNAAHFEADPSRCRTQSEPLGSGPASARICLNDWTSIRTRADATAAPEGRSSPGTRSSPAP